MINLVGSIFKTIKYYGGDLITSQDEISKLILFIVTGEANIYLSNNYDA